MQTRTLGRSGITVGELGLGTWGLTGDSYGPVTHEQARETIEAALDEGVTLIDTAGCYGHGGSVESLVGDVLDARKARDQVTLCARVGTHREAKGGARKVFDKVGFVELVNAALKR